MITRREAELPPEAPTVRGVVIIEAVIAPDGRPCSITVLESLRTDADEAALAAVRDWRFIPAQWNGEAWYSIYNIAVRIDHVRSGIL